MAQKKKAPAPAPRVAVPIPVPAQTPKQVECCTECVQIKVSLAELEGRLEEFQSRLNGVLEQLKDPLSIMEEANRQRAANR